MRFSRFGVVGLALWTCSSAFSAAQEKPSTQEPVTDKGVQSEKASLPNKPAQEVLPKAENVDLNKPISEKDILAPALDALPPAVSDTFSSDTPEEAETDKSQASEQVVSGEKQIPSLPTAEGIEVKINPEETQNSTTKSDLVEWVEETSLEELPAEPDVPEATVSADTKDMIPDQVSSQSKASFVLLGTEVPPATSTRLAWAPHQSFEGIYSATPVLVVNGKKSGPTLCLTASIHGDELNGIETVRRVLYNLDAESLSGAVIGVPIVNLQSFRRGSRYLSDRRDLNRFFPGDPNGSSAARIAHSFFNEIVKHCNAVVDIHTGSFYRTNLPQLRADLTNPKVVKMTQGFGATVVLHSTGAQGTMRRAAVNAGIPTVTLEAGAPMVLDEESVSQSVKGIQSLLSQLDMVSKFSLWGTPEPAYYTSSWQRAQVGGIIFSKVKLGALVRKGDLLGTVTNPITNVRKEIVSAYNGRVLGMALNQVVQPGFAAYHIGIQAPQDHISDPQDVTSVTQPAVESVPANSPLKVKPDETAPELQQTAAAETSAVHTESE